MYKILIVEDDITIAEQVSKFLKYEGFQVNILHSGLHAVETIKNNSFDLLILDLMLPDKNGVTCCQEIRTFSEIPIVMLTAKVEEIERIIGLQAGADDYICKPFSAQELVLRIKAILKRIAPQQVLTNSLQLNTENFVLSYQNKEVALSHIEFSLLNLLYQKPSRIYSRQQMIDLAYPDDRGISDRAVDSQIKNIRKKIETLGLEGSIIESVYGAGYRYIKTKT